MGDQGVDRTPFRVFGAVTSKDAELNVADVRFYNNEVGALWMNDTEYTITESEIEASADQEPPTTRL